MPRIQPRKQRGDRKKSICSWPNAPPIRRSFVIKVGGFCGTLQLIFFFVVSHLEKEQQYSAQYTNPDPIARTEFFRSKAYQQPVVTDKVRTHPYEEMYGTFLLPYYAVHKKMKMLEIGLGCTVKWGPGESVALWKELFPEAELWEAEYNAKYIEEQIAKGRLDGIHTLLGEPFLFVFKKMRIESSPIGWCSISILTKNTSTTTLIHRRSIG